MPRSNSPIIYCLLALGLVSRCWARAVSTPELGPTPSFQPRTSLLEDGSSNVSTTMVTPAPTYPQSVVGLLAESNNCGFAEGRLDKPYNCPAQETCIVAIEGNHGVMGCVNTKKPRHHYNTETACINSVDYAQGKCGDACKHDTRPHHATRILKCASSAAPFCGTTIFKFAGFDATVYSCVSTQPTAPVTVVTSARQFASGTYIPDNAPTRPWLELPATPGVTSFIPLGVLPAVPTGRPRTEHATPTPDFGPSSREQSPGEAFIRSMGWSMLVGVLCTLVVFTIVGLFFIRRRKQKKRKIELAKALADAAPPYEPNLEAVSIKGGSQEPKTLPPAYVSADFPVATRNGDVIMDHAEGRKEQEYDNKSAERRMATLVGRAYR